MTYSVLALDQSMTSTGWAHMREGGNRPEWGVFTLPHWGDDEGRYLWEWFTWLGHLASDKQATHIFLENTFTPQDHHESLTNKIAQFGLIGMADMVRHLCNTSKGMNVEIALVTPAQWRPVFIGASTPPKGLVKHQRRKWLKDKAKEACHVRGWMVDDDNAADALGILTFGMTTIDPRFAVSQGPLFRRTQTAVFNEARAMK